PVLVFEVLPAAPQQPGSQPPPTPTWRTAAGFGKSVADAWRAPSLRRRHSSCRLTNRAVAPDQAVAPEPQPGASLARLGPVRLAYSLSAPRVSRRQQAANSSFQGCLFLATLPLTTRSLTMRLESRWDAGMSGR